MLYIPALCNGIAQNNPEPCLLWYPTASYGGTLPTDSVRSQWLPLFTARPEREERGHADDHSAGSKQDSGKYLWG